MSVHVVPRSLPEDNKSTIMVATVCAGLLVLIMAIIGYVIFVAKPRPIRANVNTNAGRPIRTLHYTNGSWERFPDTPINQGFAVEYLRHILQRARAVTGRNTARDGEAQNGTENQNAGAQQHHNANGHGQTSGGQGHNSGGHAGTRPATA